MSRVDEALAEFPQDAMTARVLRAVYGAVPYSPTFGPMATIDDAVRELKPTASASDIARARDIAQNTDEIGDVLWMGRLLDAGDKGYAVVTGLFAAFKLFKGQGVAALETDDQQRNDAVLKALGIAYLVYKAYPGSLADKATAFRESSTGKALAIYYGAIEVALPFADNAAMQGKDGLTRLLASQGQAQAARLNQMASGHDVGRATEMLTQVTGQLQTVATHAAGYVKPITSAVGPYLPTAFDVTDKAAGALANAADVLPVYRLLASRLAAESAARRAIVVG